MNGTFNKNRQDAGQQARSQGNQNRPSQGGGRPGGGYQQSPPLEKITAPYNFVPLSGSVYFPDWSDQVSHDLPFADGICGELTCELVTDTPVYVRNGGKWDHNEIMNNTEAQSFFRVGDQIMIPGATLKGMLRNVIEIASFGKMNRVDNHRYSIRDLQNKSAYMNRMKDVRAGWLQRKAGSSSWEIIPCEYALISHELLGTPAIKRAQSSLSKYTLWGWDKLSVKFGYKTAKPNNRVTSLEGGQDGTLVFTGQPVDSTGKKFDKKNEFVFFDAKEAQTVGVSPEIQKDIHFLYTNPNTGKFYKEWEHWSSQLEQGKRIPIFYQMDGTKLGSFGFTRLYRLPYRHTIYDAIRHVDPNTGGDHFSLKPDLAETIFGFVDERKGSLKGRVSISPALGCKVEPMSEALKMILGAPKPTFYPSYLEQPNADSNGRMHGEHLTFMDDNATVRGWKRYPTRQLKDVPRSFDASKDNVATSLIPLKEGAQFRFSIKVHNLKPIEVGALVWALTWGGNQHLRHSIGMAKPNGYGVAAVRIISTDLNDMSGASVKAADCLQAFTRQMDCVVDGEWNKTRQMEQLLAMADPAVIPQCGKLTHMSLASKDFTRAKGSRNPPVPGLALMPHIKPTAANLAAAGKAEGQPLSRQDKPEKPASLTDLAGKWGKPTNRR